MNVIVETSIWSKMIRGSDSNNSRSVSIFCTLIKKNEIQMLGPIRQEILFTVPARAHFGIKLFFHGPKMDKMMIEAIFS